MSLSSLSEIIAPYLKLLALLSLATFIVSIVLIPWYIGRLPSDFFYELHKKLLTREAQKGNVVLFVLRNCLGIILILAGFAMLFLPGQGILTILIGLLCMSFPGKRHLVLFLINKPAIQRGLDWSRQKMNLPPFSWYN